MTKQTATIKIRPETRDALKMVGTKGETYDAIINALLEGFCTIANYYGKDATDDELLEITHKVMNNYAAARMNIRPSK